MKPLNKRLGKQFKDKDYRHAYAESVLHGSIAAQVRALREQRNWKQAQLGQQSAMKQSQISRMENINNEAWSIKTLLRLARAFDVALSVRFVSFGEVAEAVEGFSLEALYRPSFTDDPAFKAAPPSETTAGHVHMDESPRVWLPGTFTPALRPDPRQLTQYFAPGIVVQPRWRNASERGM